MKRIRPTDPVRREAIVNVRPTQNSFGETMFAHAQLGDLRRTRRLVCLTDQLCKHPGGSLPDKLSSPKDLKALYRLCHRDEVTHAALMTSVRQAVLQDIAQRDDTILILHDSTELDYSTHKSLAGQLGQVGRGLKRGYLCHNSLAVTPEGREVVGLVNQILHRRVRAAKNESLPKRRARKSRESRLWVLGTHPLPADWRLVDVADQGADTFEFLEHETHSGRRFVIRAHHARKVSAGHEPAPPTSTLQDYARGRPALGGRVIEVAAQSRHGRRAARVARTARLLISATPVRVHPPHAKHGEHGRDPLPMWVVRAWEVYPPPKGEPIEWFLLTNEPVTTLEDAGRVIGWYQTRWVIEELHKAKKTGCAVEGLQFRDTARLEPMIAVLSVVATTLLNLRAASQLPDARTRRASTLVDNDYVALLSRWRFGVIKDLTVHEFFFALARLGGHQNRRGDHRPGWLILWRGWTKLQAMLTGAEATQRTKCG
jgi:hypothetical protein